MASLSLDAADPYGAEPLTEIMGGSTLLETSGCPQAPVRVRMEALIGMFKVHVAVMSTCIPAGIEGPEVDDRTDRPRSFIYDL